MAEGLKAFDDIASDFDTTGEVRLRGTLPEWLAGAYVRNGPGSFTAGSQALDHLFDGYALLNRWDFDGATNTVTWRAAKRVDSKAWRSAERGQMRYVIL